MQINTKSIKSRFEKSMEKYDENAVVQKELAKKLIEKVIKYNTNYTTILELGSGTGVLTKEIKQHLTYKKYIANDLVEKSKNYVSKIIPNSEFIYGNAVKIKVPKLADLIISNAMFQWFSNLEDITHFCKRNISTDGILAFSTFGPENFKEFNQLSGLRLNYNSVDEIKKKLRSEYKIIQIEEYKKALEFKSPLELLSHMKNTGVNSLSSKPWTIAEIKDFCEQYMQKYKSVTLTYNPIIVIARPIS